MYKTSFLLLLFTYISFLFFKTKCYAEIDSFVQKVIHIS